MLQRVKSNKNICLTTQVLHRMGDTWRENEPPRLLFWNKHFFNSALLTKAYQRRPKDRYRFAAFCVIVVASRNTGKADNDMRIPLRHQILSR